jgi:hypothetical protein
MTYEDAVEPAKPRWIWFCQLEAIPTRVPPAGRPKARRARRGPAHSVASHGNRDGRRAAASGSVTQAIMGLGTLSVTVFRFRVCGKCHFTQAAG